MALTPQEQLELNDLLQSESEARERIAEQNRAMATASAAERRELESRIESERIRLRLTEERRSELQRIAEAERQATGITPGLIRISVGLEHREDILADILQALS